MNKKCWFVYLLECQDGSFYTGITVDIKKRIKVHVSGKGSRYVRSKKFKKLIASKKYKNRSEAQRDEYHIKSLNKYDKIKWFYKAD